MFREAIFTTDSLTSGIHVNRSTVHGEAWVAGELERCSPAELERYWQRSKRFSLLERSATVYRGRAEGGPSPHCAVAEHAFGGDMSRAGANLEPNRLWDVRPIRSLIRSIGPSGSITIECIQMNFIFGHVDAGGFAGDGIDDSCITIDSSNDDILRL